MNGKPEDNSPVGPRAPEGVRIEDPEYVYEPPEELYENWYNQASAGLADYVERKQVSFRAALETLDVVDARHDPAHGSYVIMAPRTDELDKKVSIRELGYSSPSPFTAWTREEWNPKLRDKMGLREYYRMKRQDGIVRGALRLLKTPIQAGRWFIEAGSETDRDRRIAEFVEKNLFTLLNVSWSNLLQDILLMCEFGHMVFEKVYVAPFGPQDKVRDGKVRLRKLGPRHPLDVRQWVYDDDGGPDGVVMEPTEMSGLPQDGIYIPIEKLAIFSLEAEAGDLRGISVLRSAYKHYFYKDTLYKIDAIQKERHGIGVPIIKLPPGFSQDDKRLADELGRNLRTNERSHIVIPPGWEIMFAKLEGQPVDCLKSIQHHNMQIMANILAPFLEDSSVDPKSTDMFLKSTRYIALTICDIINHHVIPQLVDMNFALGATRNYPLLRVRRVGEQEDLRTMSFTFRNFVGAGAIVPDDPLEDFLRKELDLPARDPATSRVVVDGSEEEEDEGGTSDPNKPQKPKPSRSGPPRQKGTPPVSPGNRSQGRDRSGGQ
jgi:hypothetical protein